ncbi:hypothetical protein BKA70DRAFT_1242085 [Coprinopsis sp. MPI-PUGE-AT-0042]|nr:hypothetical protein BKA70DRAFT_1242085 [Coprinopsis sp. MPI-PUGE-AT-0042]
MLASTFFALQEMVEEVAVQTLSVGGKTTIHSFRLVNRLFSYEGRRLLFERLTFLDSEPPWLPSRRYDDFHPSCLGRLANSIANFQCLVSANPAIAKEVRVLEIVSEGWPNAENCFSLFTTLATSKLHTLSIRSFYAPLSGQKLATSLRSIPGLLRRLRNVSLQGITDLPGDLLASLDDPCHIFLAKLTLDVLHPTVTLSPVFFRYRCHEAFANASALLALVCSSKLVSIDFDTEHCSDINAVLDLSRTTTSTLASLTLRRQNFRGHGLHLSFLTSISVHVRLFECSRDPLLGIAVFLDSLRCPRLLEVHLHFEVWHRCWTLSSWHDLNRAVCRLAYHCTAGRKLTLRLEFVDFTADGEAPSEITNDLLSHLSVRTDDEQTLMHSVFAVCKGDSENTPPPLMPNDIDTPLLHMAASTHIPVNIFEHDDIPSVLAQAAFDCSLEDLSTLRLVNQTLGGAGQPFTFRDLCFTAVDGEYVTSEASVLARLKEFLSFCSHNRAIAHYAISLTLVVDDYYCDDSPGEHPWLRSPLMYDMIDVLSTTGHLRSLRVIRSDPYTPVNASGFEPLFQPISGTVCFLELENLESIAPTFFGNFSSLEDLTVNNAALAPTYNTHQYAEQAPKRLQYRSTRLDMDCVDYSDDPLLDVLDLSSMQSFLGATDHWRDIGALVKVSAAARATLRRMELDVTGLHLTDLREPNVHPRELDDLPLMELPKLTSLVLKIFVFRETLHRAEPAFDVLAWIISVLRGSGMMCIHVECDFGDLPYWRWDWQPFESALVDYARESPTTQLTIDLLVLYRPDPRTSQGEYYTQFPQAFLRQRLLLLEPNFVGQTPLRELLQASGRVRYFALQLRCRRRSGGQRFRRLQTPSLTDLTEEYIQPQASADTGWNCRWVCQGQGFTYDPLINDTNLALETGTPDEAENSSPASTASRSAGT